MSNDAEQIYKTLVTLYNKVQFLTLTILINMIINRWVTFPFVDLTWLDSDGKYHIMLGVHIRDNHHV